MKNCSVVVGIFRILESNSSSTSTNEQKYEFTKVKIIKIIKEYFRIFLAFFILSIHTDMRERWCEKFPLNCSIRIS